MRGSATQPSTLGKTSPFAICLTIMPCGGTSMAFATQESLLLGVRDCELRKEVDTNERH